MRTAHLTRVVAALAIGSLASTAHADAGEPLRNWFDDPYLAVRSALADCPVPRGPLATEAEMRRETHSRAERGTSCWLAGRCAKPNAYLYDRGIADAAVARFAASDAVRAASLWITVQRRIVWVEGCVDPAYVDGTVENLLLGLADAELVIVNVTRDPHARPPYTALAPTDRVLPASP